MHFPILRHKEISQSSKPWECEWICRIKLGTKPGSRKRRQTWRGISRLVYQQRHHWTYKKWTWSFVDSWWVCHLPSCSMDSTTRIRCGGGWRPTYSCQCSWWWQSTLPVSSTPSTPGPEPAWGESPQASPKHIMGNYKKKLLFSLDMSTLMSSTWRPSASWWTSSTASTCWSSSSVPTISWVRMTRRRLWLWLCRELISSWPGLCSAMPCSMTSSRSVSSPASISSWEILSNYSQSITSSSDSAMASLTCSYLATTSPPWSPSPPGPGWRSCWWCSVWPPSCLRSISSSCSSSTDNQTASHRLLRISRYKQLSRL